MDLICPVYCLTGVGCGAPALPCDTQPPPSTAPSRTTARALTRRMRRPPPLSAGSRFGHMKQTDQNRHSVAEKRLKALMVCRLRASILPGAMLPSRADADSGSPWKRPVLRTIISEALNGYIQRKPRNPAYSARTMVSIARPFFEENLQRK